jgi:hypothetical protein
MGKGPCTRLLLLGEDSEDDDEEPSLADRREFCNTLTKTFLLNVSFLALVTLMVVV